MRRLALLMLQRAGRDISPSVFESWSALGALFAVALVLTLIMVGDHAAAAALFQSPQSPQSAPSAPESAPPADNSAPADAPASDGVSAPASTSPLGEAPAAPEQSDSDAAAPVGAETEGQAAPAGESQAPSPDAVQTGQQAPPPLPEPERRPIRESPAVTGEDAEMVVDEAEFIDTVVVSIAYVWLCCGIVLILVIPLIFLFLHIRGRSKIIKEEQF
jgi:cytoskeletal protein RodZ